MELLIDCLGLRHAVAAASSTSKDDDVDRPVVFVGPYEHHSNLIPWRESGCQVVMVPVCPEEYDVDLDCLEQLLKQYSDRKLKMGAFSAASNVTGQLTNVPAIAGLLHRYGALAFFDYATAAPYCTMNMNPTTTTTNSRSREDTSGNDDISLDALFWSPHKSLGGGGGTPGVLIVKKRCVSQVNAPHRSGGGTVFYVTDTHHRFLSHRVERYEGGTPPVAGIWRLGLCVLLKRRVEHEYQQIAAAALAKGQSLPSNGTDPEIDSIEYSESSPPPTIQEFDMLTYKRVAHYLAKHAPNLILLGHHHRHPNGRSDSSRGDSNLIHHQNHLPIFSFLIRWGQRFLHFNYVCAVLNDLFGIQSRGGCQCAGPYSQRLLGLTRNIDTYGTTSATINEQMEGALVQYKERAELLRPGYTRLSLPFKGLTSEEVDYVLRALVWVSKHAWALMCQYRCNVSAALFGVLVFAVHNLKCWFISFNNSVSN